MSLLMADTFETISKFVTSPPIHIGAGLMLAGMVLKFAERGEVVLNENTKAEIALWMRGIKLDQPVTPSTVMHFLHVFESLFGNTLLQWMKCSLVLGAIAASVSVFLFHASLDLLLPKTPIAYWMSGMCTYAVFVCCSFGSLFICDWGLRGCLRLKPEAFYYSWVKYTLIIVTMGMCATIVTGFTLVYVIAFGAWMRAPGHQSFAALSQRSLEQNSAFSVIGLATVYYWFFWLGPIVWGLLRLVHRLGIGCEFVKRHFDVEKHPLQSIGFVAGALVAVSYWSGAAICRLWH